MILKNISIGLIILGIVFILLGVILKRKKIKYIGITIFAVIIVFWIGFYIWAIYDASTEYERRFGNETTNNDYKVESNEEDKTDKPINEEILKNGAITKIENNNIYYKDRNDNENVIKNADEIGYIDARTAEIYSFDSIKVGYYIDKDNEQSYKIFKNVLGEDLKKELLISLSLPDNVNMMRTQIEGIKEVEQLGNNEAIVTFIISDIISSEYYPDINDEEHKFEVKLKVTNDTKYNTRFHDNITYNAETIEEARSFMIYIRLDENTLNNEYPEITTFDAYSN